MREEAKLPKDSVATAEREETFFETLAGYCSVLVIGVFVLTFLAQNFKIPSGSMKNTLLIGDHLLVDRETLAPPARWMPLVHYREPKRGDIIVFHKPVADLDKDGNPDYPFLVKRLIGLPGDHIQLRNGIVILNGVAQNEPYAQATTAENHSDFLDEFPSVPPVPEPGNFITEAWTVDIKHHIENGELVVPPGEYFMMGDNRHNSADSRFWDLCRGRTLLEGRCSTTGHLRRRTTRSIRRASPTPSLGWATWPCTSSRIPGGNERCM